MAETILETDRLRLRIWTEADLDFIDPACGADLNPTIVYVLEKDQWTA